MQVLKLGTRFVDAIDCCCLLCYLLVVTILIVMCYSGVTTFCKQFMICLMALALGAHILSLPVYQLASQHHST